MSPRRHPLTAAWALASTLLLSACGGGDDSAPLTIDEPVQYASRSVAVLHGGSFVPPGSTCPNTGEYIIIGTLGSHTTTALNETTNLTYPVFQDLWVCNSEGGRVMHWSSNPITLAAGPNRITVTMVAPGRSASATLVVPGR